MNNTTSNTTSKKVAAEICSHLTGYGQPGSPPPSACVATCPAVVRDRETGLLRPFDISEADMLRVRFCVFFFGLFGFVRWAHGRKQG